MTNPKWYINMSENGKYIRKLNSRTTRNSG